MKIDMRIIHIPIVFSSDFFNFIPLILNLNLNLNPALAPALNLACVRSIKSKEQEQEFWESPNLTLIKDKSMGYREYSGKKYSP